MSLSELPVELLRHIITLALPPPTRYSGPERNTLLKQLALVDSTFREIAQATLMSHLHLTKVPAMHVLLDQLVTTSGTPSARLDFNKTRSLVVRPLKELVMIGSPEWRIVRQCVNLEIVWYDPAGFETELFLDSIGGLRHLRSINLTSIRPDFLPQNNPPVNLPITSLTLSDSTLFSPNTPWQLLNSLNFTHLILLRLRRQLPPTPEFHLSFPSIAKNLISLYLSTGSPTLILQHCTSLKHLFIEMFSISSGTLLQILRAVPLPLESLHIGSRFPAFQVEGVIVDADSPKDGLGELVAVRGLKRLVLEKEGMRRYGDGVMDRIGKKCEGRGVVVKLADKPGKQTWVDEDWEPGLWG